MFSEIGSVLPEQISENLWHLTKIKMNFRLYLILSVIVLKAFKLCDISALIILSLCYLVGIIFRIQ